MQLFSENILPQMRTREKIDIVTADAIEYLASLRGDEYDFCFADIWEGLADGAPLYIKIKEQEARLGGIHLLDRRSAARISERNGRIIPLRRNKYRRCETDTDSTKIIMPLFGRQNKSSRTGAIVSTCAAVFLCIFSMRRLRLCACKLSMRFSLARRFLTRGGTTASIGFSRSPLCRPRGRE